MKPVKEISLSMVVLLFCSYAFSQSVEKHTQRLSDLAKIWGAVKFLHPYPAYRKTDWDEALIEAIPKVNAAKSASEYAAALNTLLKALEDDQTYAFVKSPKEIVLNNLPTIAEPLKLEGETLYFNAIAAALQTSQSKAHLNAFQENFFTLFEKARYMVIDCRIGQVKDQGALFDLNYNIQNILSEILDQKVTLGSIRYRIHNGYAPQDGSSSGGYYSGLVTDAPVTLGSEGQKPFKTPPIIAILDANSSLAPVFSGMQEAGKAVIISESFDLGLDVYTMELSEGINVKIRNTELLSPNGSLGFLPDTVAGKGLALELAQKLIADRKFSSFHRKKISSFDAQLSQKDLTYPEMEYPDREYRLLALFRFWNVINYFYPYKNLIGEDWDSVLKKYIPEFEANKDAAAYRLTAGKMVAEIHDSHGFFQPPRLKNPPAIFLTPTVEDYAQNQTYIRGVLDDSSGFRLGDVVLEVDGVPIAKVLEKFTTRVSASTPQAMMRQVHGYGIFRGEKDTKAVFKLKGLDGKLREVTTIRNVSTNDPRFGKFDFSKRKSPAISVLPSGFGYVDLDRLQPSQVDSMFQMIKEISAVIFDMRGYPNGTAWQIAPRLSEKIQPIAALFENPIVEAKTITDGEEVDGTNFMFSQRLPKREKARYIKAKL